MLKPVFIRDDGCLKRIHIEDIIGLTTEGNYTKVYLVGKIYFMIRASLVRAYKKLPQDLFIRIHRSYVVSINHINDIRRDHLLVDGEPLPIARQYYKSLMGKLVVLE